jgi:hypothetical protein
MKGIEREALIIREVLRSVGGRRWVKDARDSRAEREEWPRPPYIQALVGGRSMRTSKATGKREEPKK